MKYCFFVATLLSFFPLIYSSLLFLQQSGYSFIRKKSFWQNYGIVSILVAIATILNILIENSAQIAIFLFSIVASVTACIVHFLHARGRVKFTSRIKRLVSVSFVIYLIPSLVLLFFAPPACLGFSILWAAPAVFVAACMMKPFEEKNNRRYSEMLKLTLQDAPHLIRVGITGSAGKTSVKNILEGMLSMRYRVLATEKNFNTPLGLWLSVKGKNLQRYDIFIAEMGARRVGDIKELVGLVKPDAGIVTSVLPQHLETFRTLAAVQKEKAELPRGIVSGIAVLNASDPNVRKMAEETLAEVHMVGDGGNYMITDLKADYKGTTFTLNVKSNKNAAGARSNDSALKERVLSENCAPSATNANVCGQASDHRSDEIVAADKNNSDGGLSLPEKNMDRKSTATPNVGFNEVCAEEWNDKISFHNKNNLDGGCSLPGKNVDGESAPNSDGIDLNGVGTEECDKISFHTDVLGKHTAVNIALAAALALRFGIPKEDLQFAVESLKPVPHRLELTKNSGGVYVLDDGYNSNISGAENALEILSTYPGRRIVFSQGLVELGQMEREENAALGKKIAEVADILILTGKLGDYIYEGAKGGDVKIYRVKNVKEGSFLLKKLLTQGDILYLQNDLPELYR